MQIQLACLTFVTTLAAMNSAAAGDKIISQYSALAGRSCTSHIDDAATGASTTECPGIHGFRLLISQDDERSSVSIVTPDRRVFPLNYWDVVTRGFSSLTGKAEWRVAAVGGKAVPVALIVRIITIDQSDPEHPKRVQVLAIAKITPDMACVTHRLDALASNATARAREMADAANADCLASPPDNNRPQKG